MEIADLIDKVIGRIGNEFWERVRATLQRKLEEANLPESWYQKLDKDEDGIAWEIFLNPKAARDPESVFCYGLGEEKGGAGRYHIYQGVLQPSPVPRAAKKAVSDLQDHLRDEGYKKSKSCTVWKYIRDFTSDNEFVLTVAEKGDEYASAVAETFWDFFEATRADVEKLNAQLLGNKKKPGKSR